MKSENIARSNFGRILIKVLAAGMESRFRYRFFDPTKILNSTGPLNGLQVLEVGCGTGFFTLPAARLIGEHGSLVAIDSLPESVELVSAKVTEAGLKNVQVINRDALNTGFIPASFSRILLFGVIPAPMLPLNQLLPEMHRILKTGGILSVWPPIPGWQPRILHQADLFTFDGKQNGVHNFRKK
jgi:ubiquinone/menaquinone biosynthesis C-methylase UbiE